jgi:hypothetical protein
MTIAAGGSVTWSNDDGSPPAVVFWPDSPGLQGFVLDFCPDSFPASGGAFLLIQYRMADCDLFLDVTGRIS